MSISKCHAFYFMDGSILGTFKKNESPSTLAINNDAKVSPRCCSLVALKIWMLQRKS
jgi:hypothetical protein